MDAVRRVAALCVAGNSVYKTLPEVDCYDRRRGLDAFRGGCPVVCHPPCRAWSAYTRHQAKVPEGEPRLALDCVRWLRSEGGVLEHPAHSRLWDAASLPLPGEPERDGLWSLAVQQAWWGYPMKKATWLCFSRVPPGGIEVPFALRYSAGDRRRQQLMSKTQRAATIRPFAEWLVAAARLAGETR